jgi:hypothetical protein
MDDEAMTRDEIRRHLEDHKCRWNGECRCGQWKSSQVMSFTDHDDHLADVLHEALQAERSVT